MQTKRNFQENENIKNFSGNKTRIKNNQLGQNFMWKITLLTAAYIFISQFGFNEVLESLKLMKIYYFSYEIKS